MYGNGSHSNTAPHMAAGTVFNDHRERFVKHTTNVKNFLSNLNSGDMATHWFYFITKVVASVCTLFLLAQILIVSGSVLFWDSPELAVFVTNTFYTSNDNEVNISWPIVPTPSWNGFARPALTASPNTYTDLTNEHNYECMWVSQQGWGLCNASSGTVASYQQCLKTNYQSQISACTSSLTNSWPTLNIYSQCINDRLAGSSRWNLNAFKTCIETNLWPLYDIPQDVDTTFFLGAFSWPLLMLTGAFLMVVFAMYTFYPVDYEDATLIEQGKTKKAYVRLGVMWTIIPILMATFWIVLMLMIAFRAGNTTWPNANTNYYPSTQQTNVIVVVSSLAVFFYFLLELSEFQDKRTFDKERGKGVDQAKGDMVFKHEGHEHEGGEGHHGPGDYGHAANQLRLPTPATMSGGRGGVYSKMFSLQGSGSVGYYFPNPNANFNIDSLQKVTNMYSPVLLNTWSDAYLFHPIFVVGAIGATMQVFTADIYNIFFCLLFSRIAHLGVSRCVYFTYISEKTAGESSEAIQSTKVLGLALHFAAFFAVLVATFILYDTAKIYWDYLVITSLFALTYIVPEALRLIGHLVFSFSSHQYARAHNIWILLLAQFIWAWDLLVMIIYVWIIFWGSSSNRGTKPFLLSSLNAINTALYAI